MYRYWYLYNPDKGSSVGGSAETFRELSALILYHVEYYKALYPHFGIISISQDCPGCTEGKVKKGRIYVDCKHCHGQGEVVMSRHDAYQADGIKVEAWRLFHAEGKLII